MIDGVAWNFPRTPLCARKRHEVTDVENLTSNEVKMMAEVKDMSGQVAFLLLSQTFP